MPPEVEGLAGNPNVCPACARLLAELDGGKFVEAGSSMVDSPGEGTYVPRGATQYGGTFVWGHGAACEIEQGS